MQKKYVIISLEGNVGAGKSTLFEILRQRFPDALFLMEPLESWQSVNGNSNLNILEKYYADPQRWGLTFQIYAYQSRLMMWDQQLKQFEDSPQKSATLLDSPSTRSGDVQIVFTERSVESSRELFFKTCYQQGFVNELEYHIYEQFYTWLMNNYHKYQVDCVIYVNTPAETCLQRLLRRGRAEESSVPIEYLKQLQFRHEDWLYNQKNNFTLIEVDAKENYATDLEIRDRVARSLVEQINAIL